MKKATPFILLIWIFSVVWAEERTVTTRDPRTGRRITQKVEVAEKQPAPHENKSVLVEAFMVRISVEALSEVGVNPVGQAPQGTSILKIIACLDDPEKATVVSGAKVTARHNNEARVRNEETFYVKRESVSTSMGNQGPIESKAVSFDSYSSGKTLNAIPRIQSEDKIQLEVAYSDSGIIQNEEQTIPPTQISYDWSGVMALQSGTSAIAGATQDDDTVTFLILTATIQD